MNDKATGVDGCEAFEAGFHPVGRLNRVEHDARGGIVSGRERDEVCDRVLIRCVFEMDGDVPAPVRPLEGGDGGGRFIEAFGQHIDDAARGGFKPDGKSRTGGGGCLRHACVSEAGCYPPLIHGLPTDLSTGDAQRVSSASLSPCGRGCLRAAKAGEGFNASFEQFPSPGPAFGWSTLSHKGRGNDELWRSS